MREVGVGENLAHMPVFVGVNERGGPSITNEELIFAAKSIILPAAEKAEALVGATGAVLTVKTDVYLEDGSKHWATTLATLLCANPDLAKGNRQNMAELITQHMDLAEPFEPTRLSKALTVKAKEYVAQILSQHGYECSTLKHGLSIRDIVKGNLRLGAPKPTTVDTRFYADHIDIDGVAFQYRPRERTPMGEAHHDFSIRVAGVDVPLMAVLKLRKIGIAEFQLADERARGCASETEAANREQLERDYRPPPGLSRFYDKLQAATRDSGRARQQAQAGYAAILSTWDPPYEQEEKHGCEQGERTD